MYPSTCYLSFRVSFVYYCSSKTIFCEDKWGWLWKFWIRPTWFPTCFEQCKCEQESTPHIVSLIKSYFNGQFLITESLLFSEDAEIDLHKFAVLNQSVILSSCRSQRGSNIFNAKLSFRESTTTTIIKLNARVSWRAVWYIWKTYSQLPFWRTM